MGVEHTPALSFDSQATFVLVAALVLALILRWFRQPAAVGFLLAGIILGPSGLAVISDRTALNEFAELGILLLLFLVGMEMSLRAFREVWVLSVVVMLGQLALCGFLAMSLGGFYSWSWPEILVVTFCFGLSSTAVVIKILEQIDELRTRVGQIAIGILIAQDLAVVPMIVIVKTLSGDENTIIQATALKVILSIVFMGVLVWHLSRRRRLHIPLERLAQRAPELVPLAGLAICFGAAALSSLLGLSGAYGAFLAGLIVGNSTARSLVLHQVSPIESILVMVFFLSVGLLVDLSYVRAHLGAVIFFSFLVIMLKSGINVILLRLFNQPWPSVLLVSALLAQMGEFAFLLSNLAYGDGILRQDLHKIIVTVTAITLAISPIYQFIAMRLHRAVILSITSWRETLRLTFGRH